MCFVEIRGCAVSAAPHLMRVAVLALGVPALPRARRHRAARESRQRSGPAITEELIDAHPQGVLLVPMRPAQPRRGGTPLPLTTDHQARADPVGRIGTLWQQRDLLLGQ